MTDQSKISAEWDELPARVSENYARTRALAQQLSEMAGRIAITESEVARVHEQIARAGLSAAAAQAGERAIQARRFAEAERRVERRWANWSLSDGERRRRGRPDPRP